MANSSLLDKVVEYLIEDLTAFSVHNAKTEKLKQELQEILGCLDKVDLASIVTHHENHNGPKNSIPRLKQFMLKLQTVLGADHQVCTSLKNSEIFRSCKLLPEFKSQIVINLDEVMNPKGTGDRSKKEELEDLLDSYAFESPKAKKAIETGFDSLISQNHHKRQRSIHHKKRKNMRNEVNRAKKQLLNTLNL